MRIILILLTMLAPVQASALSCMRWYVENAYVEARDSVDPYLVVRGQLSFAEGALPKVDYDRQELTPPETRIPARIKGFGLRRGEFSVPFDTQVTLVVQCYGPWCASAQSGADSLAFIKRVEGTYEIWTNPCGGHLFQSPDDAMLDTVRACFKGETCTPAEQ